MKYGAKKRGGPGMGKSPVENKHTKEEFELLTHLLQTSVRISRPEKKEGMSRSISTGHMMSCQQKLDFRSWLKSNSDMGLSASRLLL